MHFTIPARQNNPLWSGIKSMHRFWIGNSKPASNSSCWVKWCKDLLYFSIIASWLSADLFITLVFRRILSECQGLYLYACFNWTNWINSWLFRLLHSSSERVFFVAYAHTTLKFDGAALLETRLFSVISMKSCLGSLTSWGPSTADFLFSSLLVCEKLQSTILFFPHKFRSFLMVLWKMCDYFWWPILKYLAQINVFFL